MAVTYLLRRYKPATISSVLSFSTKCFVGRTSSLSVPTEAPPVPKKIPFAISSHGITRQDPFHWMKNTDDTDFVDFLKRENSYSQAFMADTETLRRDLFSEMKTRIPEEIFTPPERWGQWLYRQYIPKGKEYPLLCRRLEKGKTNWLSGLFRGEEEEVVLDWNQIAEQFGYVHVGVCRVSPDHNYLAYTVDPEGDGITLFYTVTDENQRPHRVVVTNVESDGRDDAVVFTERDSSFCVDITTTKDGKFVTINSNSRTSSEVYIVNADKPMAGLQRTRERVPGVQCFLEHHNGFFYILTNSPSNAISEWSGEGYYLTRCLVEEIEASDWQTVFRPDDDVVIQDMDMFNDYLVLYLNKKGLPMLCSIDMPIKANTKHMDDLVPWYFPLPVDSCSVAPGSNHDFQSSIYRVVLSSPVIPDTIVDYDVSRRLFSIVQQEGGVVDNSDSSKPWYTADRSTENNGQLNDRTSEGEDGQLDSRMPKWEDLSDTYVCERQEVSSHDGVEVPLTILYSREAWKKSESPGMLIGYGAYGEVLDKSWCTNRLSMLDRGWVIAFADVRGGGSGEFSWHKSGTRSLKQNSIQDFIYSAKYLVEKGYVHRHHLAAVGYSAGAILPAAAMNMHPSLFQAVILKVPFVDVLNTLSDPNLPLTLLDHEEFGNPDNQTDFGSILSYSPYDKIRKDVCYPSMLVTTSFHDSRVGVWEGAKWVAKIRDSTCHDCSRAVILKTNMNGGHFGEGGRYAQCEETAFDYAFLLKVMGHHNNR
ncbi:Prolyl oligopeptidase family protein [Arabidopsis thaliana]|uniref:Prolyl endopeptidase n=1 Tax=Arabidopsis thaliana TaxID=3702 RepID=F4I0I5_ARATH|nr:Prolyl oligopeptidase family protein [Arabidopsis thaliana]AEE34876.1 Prolyl oligopeptidase family protein [Arabidopsis thaliana]|eukprot:NP_177065.2 Prolyl oligopeptidase family protein [Arabidopsis thaliana]